MEEEHTFWRTASHLCHSEPLKDLNKWDNRFICKSLAAIWIFFGANKTGDGEKNPGIYCSNLDNTLDQTRQEKINRKEGSR